MKFLNFKSIALLCLGISISNEAAYSQKISDQSLKKDVSAIENALEQLVQLKPEVFRYDQSKAKGLSLPAGLQYGFNIESVKNNIPGFVSEQKQLIPAGKNSFNTGSYKTIDITNLIPLLVGAIQEQQQKIEQLENELRLLKTSANTGQ